MSNIDTAVARNARNIVEAARLAKTKGLAVATMSGGHCAINKVTYAPNGTSSVQLVAAWLTGAQALNVLRGME